jgi:hypothetical protein
MHIMPHLPASLRHWHFSRALRRRSDPAEVWAEINAIWDEVASLRAGQDSFDVGLIEADLNGSRANARIDAVFDKMRELTDEIRAERSGIADLPCYETTRDELADANPMPSGSNESLSRELDSTDEEMLAGLATELWEHDEYLQIVAEDYRQRNGGAG